MPNITASSSGAITILRQQAYIDFELLMSGKLTLDELDRVKRCVLMSPVRLPIFMANKEKYITALRQIARLNGIPVSKSAPVKPKLRGTRPQSDSRCPPISAYGAQRSSSGSPMIPHQTIRNKIVRALCTFDFPPSPFSNALIPDQDYPVPPEESSKTQAGRLSSHSRANSKADKTMANIQNNWNTLPEGVCGCRLFTHGNWDSEQVERTKPTNGSGSRETDKTKGRNDNNTDPSGIQDIPVGMSVGGGSPAY
ncbi:hypothetical protein FGIG_07943 [Fasciola gigantica]|uniref:Uncharacterized protein n=1 Tax=Fasciola gigantica TaxID=46835 RepID=A0A504YBJ3_FASGI|nr:hypothetical protein FGIG_07943 [Fasciola gigantica]